MHSRRRGTVVVHRFARLHHVGARRKLFPLTVFVLLRPRAADRDAVMIGGICVQPAET